MIFRPLFGTSIVVYIGLAYLVAIFFILIVFLRRKSRAGAQAPTGKPSGPQEVSGMAEERGDGKEQEAALEETLVGKAGEEPRAEALPEEPAREKEKGGERKPPPPERVPEPPEEKKFICALCGRGMKSKGGLTRHINAKHKCLYCGFIAKSRAGRTRHISARHPGALPLIRKRKKRRAVTSRMEGAGPVRVEVSASRMLLQLPSGIVLADAIASHSKGVIEFMIDGIWERLRSGVLLVEAAEVVSKLPKEILSTSPAEARDKVLGLSVELPLDETVPQLPEAFFTFVGQKPWDPSEIEGIEDPFADFLEKGKLAVGDRAEPVVKDDDLRLGATAPGASSADQIYVPFEMVFERLPRETFRGDATEIGTRLPVQGTISLSLKGLRPSLLEGWAAAPLGEIISQIPADFVKLPTQKIAARIHGDAVELPLREIVSKIPDDFWRLSPIESVSTLSLSGIPDPFGDFLSEPAQRAWAPASEGAPHTEGAPPTEGVPPMEGAPPSEGESRPVVAGMPSTATEAVTLPPEDRQELERAVAPLSRFGIAALHLFRASGTPVALALTVEEAAEETAAGMALLWVRAREWTKRGRFGPPRLIRLEREGESFLLIPLRDGGGLLVVGPTRTERVPLLEMGAFHLASLVGDLLPHEEASSPPPLYKLPLSAAGAGDDDTRLLRRFEEALRPFGSPAGTLREAPSGMQILGFVKPGRSDPRFDLFAASVMGIVERLGKTQRARVFIESPGGLICVGKVGAGGLYWIALDGVTGKGALGDLIDRLEKG